MSKSILLADDSATIRKVVELTFSDTDFHVRSVASGSEALEVLELLRPDLVLADVVMPEPTGYEICRRIKSSDRPVPVLLLAGTFEAFDHDEARASGADGCLLKPFDSKTLLDRVASLLADREALADSGVEPVDEAPEAEESPLEQAEESIDSPASGDVPVAADGFDSRIVDAVVDAVIARLSDEVVREIAREVVPRVAESVVRERIRELEREDR